MKKIVLMVLTGLLFFSCKTFETAIFTNDDIDTRLQASKGREYVSLYITNKTQEAIDLILENSYYADDKNMSPLIPNQDRYVLSSVPVPPIKILPNRNLKISLVASNMINIDEDNEWEAKDWVPATWDNVIFEFEYKIKDETKHFIINGTELYVR
jgi:hypothetical protein